MRIIDADKLMNKYKGHHDFYLNAWDGDFKSMGTKDKARCDELTNCIAEIVNAPTIKTKQVKYYDDDEKVWKIGEVIVNTLHDLTDSYKGSEYNGNIKD